MHICKNELNKSCFAHDAAYPDSKDLGKRTVSDKVLKGRANKISINPKYNGYQWELASMVYKFFEKKTESAVIATDKTGVRRRRVYASFKDIILAEDLAEMGS